MMDAATFFAMVFGSEAFEQYVGELRLATTMKKSMQREEEDDAFDAEQAKENPGEPPLEKVTVSTADVDADELAFEQRRREVLLAKNLADDVLRDYVEGRVNDIDFAKTMRRKADDLASTPFGATLLLVIARAYTVAGQRHLASGTTADFGLALQETAHDASTRYHVVRDAVKAVASTRAAQRSDDELSRFQIQQQQQQEEAHARAYEEDLRDDPLDDDDDFFEERGSSQRRRRRYSSGETSPTSCEDAADVEIAGARYMIVHSEATVQSGWTTRYFYRRSSAEARWVKLPYSECAVLFERKHNWWQPLKEYGYLDVDKIKIAVADANPAVSSSPQQDDFPAPSDPGEEFKYNPAKAAESMSKANHVRMMAAVVEAAWRISIVDIDSTLRSTTKKLLTDHSVDVAIRDKRAKGLILVAQAFSTSVRATGHQESWQDQLARQIKGMGVGFKPGGAGPTPPSPP